MIAASRFNFTLALAIVASVILVSSVAYAMIDLNQLFYRASTEKTDTALVSGQATGSPITGMTEDGTTVWKKCRDSSTPQIFKCIVSDEMCGQGWTEQSGTYSSQCECEDNCPPPSDSDTGTPPSDGGTPGTGSCTRGAQQAQRLQRGECDCSGLGSIACADGLDCKAGLLGLLPFTSDYCCNPGEELASCIQGKETIPCRSSDGGTGGITITQQNCDDPSFPSLHGSFMGQRLKAASGGTYVRMGDPVVKQQARTATRQYVQACCPTKANVLTFLGRLFGVQLPTTTTTTQTTLGPCGAGFSCAVSSSCPSERKAGVCGTGMVCCQNV